MTNWRRCLCPCHRQLLDALWSPTKGVDAFEVMEAASACAGCKDTHSASYPKESPHRKQGFDITNYNPDTSTTWNDDQGDGSDGRDNAP